MTNDCELCGMDCGETMICETCQGVLDEEKRYEEHSEAQEWYDFDPDC